MANALAIAAVTAVLRDLLNDGLINHNLDSAFEFQVTSAPPDRIITEPAGNRLNLFLYRVSPNSGWSNERYPSRNSAGEACANPYLALDLHYMLSAYGNQDLNAEILIGYGMQVLHDTPVLGRAQIRASLGAPSPVATTILPAAFQELAADDLADQIEQVKISPNYLDLEEMSRLWTAFNSPLRTSSLYQVTTVLIESERSTRSAPPVRQREVFVRQLRQPTISRVLSRATPGDDPQPNRAIVHGEQLVLRGSGLRGEITRVRIGGEVVTPAATNVSERRIVVDIPNTLHPGIRGVQVVHSIAKRPPSSEEMPGELSNLEGFTLRPSFAEPLPDQPDIELVSGTDPGGGNFRGVIRVGFAHMVGNEQSVRLLLNELPTPGGGERAAFSFASRELPANTPEVNEVEFDYSAVPGGDYLVRVQVAGAETALTFDGQIYSGPSITIEATP